MVIKFNGNGDTIQCTNDATLWSQTLSKFSFSFWIYPTQAWDVTRFIMNHGSGAQNFQVHMDTGLVGRIIFRVRNAAAGTIDAKSTDLQLNKWNFVTCVYDNSLGTQNVKIYVNAVLGSTTANLTETLNQSATLVLGGSGTDYKGYMKDFRFWKSIALSQAQVTQLYSGLNETDFDPDYWLPMDEGLGDPKSWGLRAALRNGARWASDNESVVLDGIDDFIEAGVEPTIWAKTLSKFSISVWVKASKAFDTGFRTFIGCTDGNDEFSIYFIAANTDNPTYNAIGMDITNDNYATGENKFSNAEVSLDTWYNVVLTYDNTLTSPVTRFYINGVDQANSNDYTYGSSYNGKTIALDPLVSDLCLGKYVPSDTNPMCGNMKQFKFWNNTAITLANAQNLYDNNTGTPPVAASYELDLNEGSGQPKDDISDPKTGTLTNGTSWAWNTTTKRNNIKFDGVNDDIDLTNDATLWSQSLTKFSFSCWIYPTILSDTTNFRDIVNHGGASAQSFRLYINNTGDTLVFAVRNAAGAQLQATSSAISSLINTWVHVTCVYDNSLGSANIKMYVNGSLQAGTGNLTEAINQSITLLLAGVSNDLAGNMRDFRWWTTKALTAEEVSRVMYNDPVAPVPNYWLLMNEGAGSPLDNISDTKVGTLTNGAAWSFESLPITTNDPTYNGRVGYKIVVKSNDEMQTYYRYDTFGQKPFNAQGLRMTLGDSETDMSLLAIEDINDALDDNKLSGGCKYFISLTTGETVPYEDIFVGYADLLEESAEARNKLFKFITIVGSQILADYRFLNYFRAAKLSELDDPSTVKGRAFESWFHVDRAISKSSELLYDKIIIKNKAHWDTIDLHTEVNTIISGIALGTVSLRDFMEYNRNITGARWGTDFKNKKERFFYAFPELTPTNIILKSGYEISRNTDLASQVAWVYPPFSYLKDSSTNVNHSTILHGITDTDDVFIAGSPVVGGATSLTFRAVGQSFPLPADARRIRRINLMLSMKGKVTSPENKLNGKLCLADSNGKPLGTKLDKFNIPLDDIEKDPSVISVTVDVDPEDIEGDSQAWILLYQRSGTDEKNKGDPNHDEANTILWHHNNIIGTAGQYPSATAQEGDRHKEPLNWLVKTNGPQYAFSVNSDIQRINTITTPQLFPQFGVKEKIINVSDIRDTTTVNSFLQYKAFILSQQKRYIPSIKAKIVNNLFYRPNQTVLMTVSKPIISATMRIERVTYDIRPIDEQTGENNSSRLCELSLVEINNPSNYVKFNCDY